MKKHGAGKALALLLVLALGLPLCACGKTVPGTETKDESTAQTIETAPAPQSEAEPASEPDSANVGYGKIVGGFTGMTAEIAAAYLAVVDDVAAHLGYDEAEASEGEYLHGGFVRDWDGDGVPELCLLLEANQRDNGGWDGTPMYGWNPPALCLYTWRSGQAERVDERYLSSLTAGQETAIIVLATEVGTRYIWWERDFDPAAGSASCILGCYELKDGTMRETELPGSLADALRNAETMQEALNALGADKAQLLLYNNSGEAGIEGEANARALRAALAEMAN